MGRSILAVAVLALATGCGDSSTSGIPAGLEDYVGAMGDASYLNRRGKPPRPNARGEGVALESFAGSFVWVEYAAPWCQPCVQQAGVMRKLEAGLGDDVVVLTVMTSEQGGYGHPATPATASSWASARKLDPARVLAADLSALTVPRHILFSPRGHTLFAREGFMSEAEIRAVLEARRQGWRAWDADGTEADWMQ